MEPPDDKVSLIGKVKIYFDFFFTFKKAKTSEMLIILGSARVSMNPHCVSPSMSMNPNWVLQTRQQSTFGSPNMSITPNWSC